MLKNNSLAIRTPTDASAPALQRIDPLFNAVFIRVFGKDESKPLVRTLVNLIFDKVGLDPIGEITSINAEHTLYEGHVECKAPRIDIRIETAGRLVDLEVQNYPEDINSRSSLYASQLMVSSVGAGTNYKDVPQVVVITLLSDMVMFPNTDEVVSVCRMQWQDGSGASLQTDNDRILFVVVELDKVRKRYNRLNGEVLADELTSWLYLLVSGYGDRQEMEEMIANVQTIEEFAKRYGLAVNDPEVTAAYESYLSAEREYKSRQDFYARMEREAIERGTQKGLERGFKQGIEQGIEQGLERGLEQGLEQGLERGLEQGLERGLEQGREEERERIKKAMLDSGMTQDEVEQILDAANEHTRCNLDLPKPQGRQ